jgi:NAD(P)-dependent dehydrogenase (short-subunit alcohol dehydrogenase family)
MSIMRVRDKVCVVTGAASGIGEAVARAYAEAGARGVVVADLKSSRDRLASVAADIDGLAVTADVAREGEVQSLITAAEARFGPVDVFFSNAGLSRKGQETASDTDWDVSWRVHVMSHVFAARTLVPGMLARGSGYLLNTASAAGLLASLNSMRSRHPRLRALSAVGANRHDDSRSKRREGRWRDAACRGGPYRGRGDGSRTLPDPVARDCA